MSWRQLAAMALFGVAALAGNSRQVHGQTAQSADAPDGVPIRFGSLALAPTLQVANLGFDDNVFNASQNPRSDLTATIRPAVEAWLRLPRMRITGRSEVDYVYFNQLNQLRSFDTDNAGRIELLLNRVTAYATGMLTSTRHRRNLEIDARLRSRHEAASVGLDVRLTAKTSADVHVLRSSYSYGEDAVYQDTNLARTLNRSSAGEGLTLRYALTPLTTVALDVERDRNRFDSASERNSEGFRVGPAVEFKPFALVSGRASVGLRRRTFHDPHVPEFQGTAVRLDLSYTLLGRTRFAVTAERDLASSYRVSDSDYIRSGFTAGVTQRLTDQWDVRGRLGRASLTYRTGISQTDAGQATAETFVTVGAEVGYRMGRTRVAVHADHGQRDSSFRQGRQYERLSIGTSFTLGL